tara:strand:+ start:212 stop:364 length:153 start_codon:yes stop_codon:yes gene_type:complete
MGYRGYGLVRDPQGNVKFDDWNNVPAPLWAILTDTDKEYVLKKREEAKLT